jgi:hypothetical protein
VPTSRPRRVDRRAYPRGSLAADRRRQGEGLHLRLAALVEPGGQGDGGSVGVQVEVLRDQAGQGGSAEARPARGGVQVEAVAPIQTAEGSLRAPGSGEQPAQLIRHQFPPGMPDIHLRVEELQGVEGIGRSSLRPHQPTEEATDGANVVVNRLRHPPLRRALDQGQEGRSWEAQRIRAVLANALQSPRAGSRARQALPPSDSAWAWLSFPGAQGG